ncbi:hypothetical protein [Desertimonas flava]|uniref:HD domain-containing protein n=1 Tax=Desertimonas flava TaxID=2064846 RepID=UPI001968DB49|nr:hypothetical protein [Desertimonas flava]
MSDEIELRLAWACVAARGDPPAPTHRVVEVFDDVVGRHRQAHRRYHGLRHVVWVVRHVHELAARATGSGIVDVTRAVAAAFFHDAVYVPTASDNEERSALLATRQLAALGWAAGEVAAVADDIRATAGHITPDDADAPPADLTRAVLLDADLAVLGSDAAAYQAYATGVRAEYAHVDDAAWRVGRGAVVRTLLERQRLYLTDAGAERWDQLARANLTAELATLA